MIFNFIRNTLSLRVNIRRVSMMSSELLNSVPDVEIDPEGTFKYVLIRVYAPQTKDGNEPSKMIVRGNSRGPYHAFPNHFWLAYHFVQMIEHKSLKSDKGENRYKQLKCHGIRNKCENGKN
ncbi:uncharacterized protein isoform X3 [Rhodnius prolixus]|uniref:uncharacterized protein isoform X3 n=1 Tax=Rhodnius prolixus TaxID=13249 RepID=UPI003D18A81D